MDRELAKELKVAGFPIAVFRAGHKFYPPEQGGGWSDDARQHGVTVTQYDLEDGLQEPRLPARNPICYRSGGGNAG